MRCVPHFLAPNRFAQLANNKINTHTSMLHTRYLFICIYQYYGTKHILLCKRVCVDDWKEFEIYEQMF